MKKELLTIGTRLEVYEETKDDNKRVWVSQLELKKGDFLYISMPISKGYTVPLRPGSVVKIVFVKEKNTYSFKAEVIENIWSKIPKIKIALKSPLKKIQRRKYYRLSTLIPTEFYLEKQENNKHTGVIENISGGGLLLAASLDLKFGDIIKLKLDLKNYGVLNLKGKVVRKAKNEKSLKYNYLYGIYFMDINEKNRDIIIKYIFEEQRKLRNRGLI